MDVQKNLNGMATINHKYVTCTLLFNRQENQDLKMLFVLQVRTNCRVSIIVMAKCLLALQFTFLTKEEKVWNSS